MALKLLGWRGEQQLPFQFLRTGTAGDAGLLVSRLHPVRQPAQTTVAVQRVGSDGPGTAGEGNQSPKRTLHQVKHVVLALNSGRLPVVAMTCQQMALSSYKLALFTSNVRETKEDLFDVRPNADVKSLEQRLIKAVIRHGGALIHHDRVVGGGDDNVDAHSGSTHLNTSVTVVMNQ